MHKSSLIDAEEQRLRPAPTSVDALHEQYLAARDGTNLRPEAVTPKGRAETWSNVTDAFEGYVWRQWKAAETWEAETDVRPTSHHFTHRAACDRRARVLGADRAAYRLWGEDVTTVHIVRRARAFGANGQPQPPADHLIDLLAANGNVYDRYRYHLEEKRGLTFARLSVLEPHRTGYAHIHDGLWIKDPADIVDTSDIRPALESHCRAVPQARLGAHGPNAVRVEHYPDRRSFPSDPQGVPPTTALPRELTKLLGGFAPHEETTERGPSTPPVCQSDAGPLRFYALLWARGLRQWRPDQSVFPRLVGASQEWFGPVEDVESARPMPRDATNYGGGGGVETQDVEARPVDFEQYVSDGEEDGSAADWGDLA